MYLNGIGCDKDEELGYSWYFKAKAQISKKPFADDEDCSE